MKSIKFDPRANIAGTSFHDVTLSIDPSLLSRVYPGYVNDGDKTTREWYFWFDGDLFTLYDWKETNEYASGLPSYHEFWSNKIVRLHIGSKTSSYKEQAFKEALLKNLEDHAFRR